MLTFLISHWQLLIAAVVGVAVVLGRIGSVIEYFFRRHTDDKVQAIEQQVETKEDELNEAHQESVDAVSAYDRLRGRRPLAGRSDTTKE